MHDIEIIKSTKNQIVKDLTALYKPKHRKERNEFIIEGIREISRYIDNNGIIHLAVICKEEYDTNENKINLQNIDIKYVSKEVFEKISYKNNNSEGILCVGACKEHKLPNETKKDSFYIICENLEKPGNIGAILRTADAVNADGLILTEQSMDLYNPNIIRSSTGALFSVPIYKTSNTELNKWLDDMEIKTYIASPFSKKSYFDINYNNKSAIIIGNEAKGVSHYWENSKGIKVKIPMNGICDSLNASISTALIAYEYLRQKTNQ